MDDVQEITQAEGAQLPGAIVRLRHLYLKNFRCFDQFEVRIEAPYVLFSGVNGIGKTSLLEALYYTCYLRSFRTHSPRELIRFGQHEFFVKITVSTLEYHVPYTIQVGFSPAKRLVKIDQKSITSYKDLMAYYRIVSVTESDLDIIQGSPHSRRLFLDQVILFLDDGYAQILKEYRQVVDQRNALLQHYTYNQDTYAILTKQLWHLASMIQERRIRLLAELTRMVNKRGAMIFHNFSALDFRYVPKRLLYVTFEEFLEHHKGIMALEQRFKRTLFGAHLDDIHIEMDGKSSRLFASRGQQKLMVMLIKMAQLELLAQGGIPGICILDDFMTDFDDEHMVKVVDALQGLGTQLIFTTPLEQSPLVNRLMAIGAQTIKLTG